MWGRTGPRRPAGRAAAVGVRGPGRRALLWRTAGEGGCEERAPGRKGGDTCVRCEVPRGTSLHCFLHKRLSSQASTNLSVGPYTLLTLAHPLALAHRLAQLSMCPGGLLQRQARPRPPQVPTVVPHGPERPVTDLGVCAGLLPSPAAHPADPLPAPPCRLPVAPAGRSPGGAAARGQVWGWWMGKPWRRGGGPCLGVPPRPAGGTAV